MKASLALEAIGQNYIRDIRELDRFIGTASGQSFDRMPYRQGVWDVTESDTGPVFGKWDYSKANSKGSRGVYIHYLLESGKLYQVAEPTSWKNSDHYFCIVDDDGEIIKLTKEHAQEWQRQRIEEWLLKNS